jgi:succinoglycan biosynthesis protein ExoM
MTNYAPSHSGPRIAEPSLGCSEAIRICVCILTYNRPHLCAAALDSVFAQTLIGNPDYQIQALVVDNDKHGTAEAVVRERANSTAVPVRYVIEEKRGIVNGRNRVLQEAREWDYLALLDDDEIATPTWLEGLLWAQKEFHADVVTGPVDAIFESAPGWVIDGGFFAARRFDTGSTPKFIETNNVLISGALVQSRRFDIRFNDTSGEDTLFFCEILRDGAKVVWCEHARVSEFISPTRTTEKWIVERAHSNANRYTRVSLILKPGWVTIGNRVLRAVGSLGIGLLLRSMSFGSDARKVKARQRIGRFQGTFAGISGRNHVYYKKGAPLT